MEWVLPNGRVRFAKPAMLGLIEIDADFRTTPGEAFPIDGELSLGTLHSENVSVELHGHRVSFDPALERIALEHSPTDGLHIDIGAATACNVQTALAGWLIRIGELALATSRMQGDRFESASVSLTAVDLHDANHELSARRVELPAGIVIRADSIQFRTLSIGKLELTVHDVRGYPDREVPIDEPARPERKLFDMRALDQLNGKLDVDLTLDLTVPVLGRRKATHHFRVPIDHGTINYRELERDLSALEDAVIDIAVRGTILVLERRVPLIPGTNKPILLWPLNDVELGLAKKRLVRLRNLPNFDIPPEIAKPSGPGGTGASGPSSVALRRLDFDNISIALSAPSPESRDRAEPPPSLDGAVVRPIIGNLSVKGDVRHDPRVALAPTALVLQAEALSAGLVELPVGKATLSATRIEIGAIENATLSFEGPSPRTLVATIRDLVLTDVTICFAQPARSENDDGSENT